MSAFPPLCLQIVLKYKKLKKYFQFLTGCGLSLLIKEF
jgi:hypothetical protein